MLANRTWEREKMKLSSPSWMRRVWRCDPHFWKRVSTEAKKEDVRWNWRSLSGGRRGWAWRLKGFC